MCDKNTDDRLKVLENFATAITMILGGVVAIALILFAVKASADEVYFGKFASQSESMRTAEATELAPCLNGGGKSGRDIDYGNCEQRVTVAEIDRADRYMLAYSRSGYTFGVFNDDDGTESAFLERRFDLYIGGDLELSLSAGASYNEQSNAKVILTPEISYTRYAIKPALQLRGDDAVISLRVDF